MLTGIGTDSGTLTSLLGILLSDTPSSFIRRSDVVSLDLVRDSGFHLAGLSGVLIGVGLIIRTLMLTFILILIFIRIFMVRLKTTIKTTETNFGIQKFLKGDDLEKSGYDPALLRVHV